MSHRSGSSFPATGKDKPEQWLRRPVPVPLEIPQQHRGDASAALARLQPASPWSPSLSPQFELDRHFSPQLSCSICTGSSHVWVSVLKTPVPPSVTFCAVHLLSYTALSHQPSGPDPAAPFSMTHATGIAAPGRSPRLLPPRFACCFSSTNLFLLCSSTILCPQPSSKCCCCASF